MGRDIQYRLQYPFGIGHGLVDTGSAKPADHLFTYGLNCICHSH